MNELLQILPLPKRSFLQNVLRQFPIETSFIELNNLIASQGWLNVSEDDIRKVEQQYNVNIRETFHLNLLEYYIVYFNDCLHREGWLSPEAQQTITHLKSLFRLDENELSILQGRIAEPLYRKKIQTALRDGYINEKEEERLNKLAYSLQLPQVTIKSIRLELTQKYLSNYVSKRLKHDRLAPEEDAELEKVASKLGLKPILEKELQRAWGKARRLWDLQNLELCVIHSMEFHQKTEDCFFMSHHVQWHEYRIHKGESYLKHIDTGDLILTANRLVYNGKGKVTQLKFSDIRDFICQDGYVEIRKHSGRNPVLLLDEFEELVIVLGRLLPG